MKLAPFLVALVLVTGCRSKADKEAYEAKRRALVAENAAKDAARAKAEADLRAACKDPSVKLPDNDQVVRWCKDEARSNALDPNSVSFPFFKGPEPVVNGCLIVYLSTLTATNAAGVEVEKRFRCEYNPKTEHVVVKL